MLTEIRCDKFRSKTITFRRGLNVVLGDDNATNSIGKSSLLMVIDFVFGGDSLLTHNNDLVEELGDHDYYFSFEFDGDLYRFRRGTFASNIVYRCDDDYTNPNPMEIANFRAFLKASYAIHSEDISFRSLVGLYARVWGKENLNVHKPLHQVPNQSAKDCVDNLIKTYNQYGPIRSLAVTLKDKEDKASALRKAIRNKIVPKIGKVAYRNNESKIEKIESEIEEIKENLAKFATNIAEISNREILELKVQKDELLASQMKLSNQLIRTQRNLSENRYIKGRHFAALKKFLPEIDVAAVEKVEHFHSGLVTVLRTELEASEKSTREELSRIESDIKSIDNRMAQTLSSVDDPGVIVDRVYDLTSALKSASEENDYYDTDVSLKNEISTLKEDLYEEKKRVLSLIEGTLNDTIRRIVSSAFSPDRKSPIIKLKENTYRYDVYEDTGTGTAYTSLLVLDLAVFASTDLPTLVHDSVLFKNIENVSVSNLLGIYLKSDKQSFVALDEVEKYGVKTAETLVERSVVQLSDSNVLYIKDWRRKGGLRDSVDETERAS